MPKTDDRLPFVLYVVWHPDCNMAEKVAPQILHHFGTARYRNIVGGAGVSVLFRSVSAPGEDLPMPIDWSNAEATATVVLIDRTLAGSDLWTQYIKSLVEEAESRGLGTRVFPVLMEGDARDISFDVQLLRWDRWEGSIADRQQQLFRELSYEFSRMLRHRLAQGIGSGENDLRLYRENIQVFLSHSKHDKHGEPVAKGIRDWLHDNSGLSSFLDVYDIPAGLSSSAVIFDSIRDGIMLAVYTDSYSSREWCRREVIEAKRRNIPMLVIDCLQTIDIRSFPYLGNVPVVRVNPEGMEQVDQVAGLLLDELFKHLLWRCRVEKFRQLYPKVLFIARPPELMTLATILDNDSGGERSIVYPDPPISLEEAQLFSNVAPNMKLSILKDWLMED